MALHPVHIQRLADALDETLRGARVRSIRQDADDTSSLLIECRTPGQNHWLYLKTSPPTPRAQLLSGKRPAPTTPSGFVMALRKHIEGMRILRVQRPPQSARIVLQLGGSEEHLATLVLALDDKGPNLFLLDAEGVLRAVASRRTAELNHQFLGQPLPEPNEHIEGGAPSEIWPPSDAELWPFLEHHYDAKEAHWRLERTRTTLARRVRQALKRTKRTLQKVEGDLARAERADSLRHEADLLQSVRGQVKRGQPHVDVVDWARDDGGTTRVILDPARSLADNIETRYRTYRRLRAAEDRILTRLDEVEIQNKALASAVHELQAADTLPALEEIRKRLEAKRWLPRADERERVEAAARLPYREARSSDGYRILVGRGAKDNDALTFKIARGRDLWLHARESSGSHVIIIRPREEAVPERTLLEAATLAAVWSSARNDTRVDVGWTEKKHVSKPPGSPPGRVSVAAMRNLLVTPDADLAHQLVANARAFDER